jgi:hypothetical protein
MKLWIDDVREAPMGYVWCKSVNGAKMVIMNPGLYALQSESKIIELLDVDHDAGDYACDGGDYIKLLDWLEETGRSYPIHIHSQNPVGVENMRRIIERNGWREIR